MSRYKVKISVELVECNETVNDTPIEQQDGSFSMVISEKDAVSIDKCERSVLKTAYPTIRSVLSEHLTEISRKKAWEMSSAGDKWFKTVVHTKLMEKSDDLHSSPIVF
ncbi:MAG: hypothetical protein GY853_05800 [PVC group bacterium]|nr:hypothetical protein [PVC group bacterium]